MFPSVFIVDFEQVSTGWEVKGGTDYRIHFSEFSVEALLETKQVSPTKISFDILLKILNQKATVSKETIGFDVCMATILSYIKPRSTTRIFIIGYSIPRHFLWFTNDT